MAYTFTQTGAQIHSILNQVPTNTSSISSINTTLTNINTGISRPDGSTVSVPNNEWTVLQSVTLPAGTYLIHGGVSWSLSSTTGDRAIVIVTGSTEPSTPRRGTRVMAAAGNTTMETTIFQTFSSSTTINLYGLQTSGAALSAFPYLDTMRLR